VRSSICHRTNPRLQQKGSISQDASETVIAQQTIARAITSERS